MIFSQQISVRMSKSDTLDFVWISDKEKYSSICSPLDSYWGVIREHVIVTFYRYSLLSTRKLNGIMNLQYFFCTLKYGLKLGEWKGYPTTETYLYSLDSFFLNTNYPTIYNQLARLHAVDQQISQWLLYLSWKLIDLIYSVPRGS